MVIWSFWKNHYRCEQVWKKTTFYSLQGNQGPDEKVTDFALALKKLFKNAKPEEEMTSLVLLQQFLTGSCLDTGRQRKGLLVFLLPWRMLWILSMEFDTSRDSINALTRRPKNTYESVVLFQSLETLTKWLESLETTIQRTHKTQATSNSQGDILDMPINHVNKDIKLIMAR